MELGSYLRNCTVESVDWVPEIRAGTRNPTAPYRESGSEFVPVLPGFLSGA